MKFVTLLALFAVFISTIDGYEERRIINPCFYMPRPGCPDYCKFSWHPACRPQQGHFLKDPAQPEPPRPRKLNKTYDGCGVTKGCFGLPDDCVASRSCLMLATYAQDSQSGDVDFSLYQPHAQPNSYVALGLSDDPSRRTPALCETFCT